MLIIRKGILISVLVFLAWLQASPLFFIGEVKPNAAFVALVILAFFGEGLILFSIAALISIIIIQNAFLLSWASIVFLLLVFTVFLSAHLWPWQALLNIVIVVSLGTVLFYVLSNPLFIVRGAALVFEEVIYNLLLAGALYVIFSRLFSGYRLGIIQR